MSFKRVTTYFLSLMLLGSSLWAQSVTPILETKISFDAQGKAQVSYNTFGQAEQAVISSKIQSALIFYAYVMNQLDEKARVALLNQVQKAVVGQIATEQGLKRVDIVANNPLVKATSDWNGKGFTLLFGREANTGNSLEVKPIPGSEVANVAALFYSFQDLARQLPENGLRLFVIATGGMNKWYREVGKASDSSSLSQAPTYALNLAVDIIEKLGGKDKNPPPAQDKKDANSAKTPDAVKK